MGVFRTGQGQRWKFEQPDPWFERTSERHRSKRRPITRLGLEQLRSAIRFRLQPELVEPYSILAGKGVRAPRRIWDRLQPFAEHRIFERTWKSPESLPIQYLLRDPSR